MLPIITAPNQILSTKAKSVTKVDKDILDFIKQMEESLNFATDPIGVGLAAPQVAKSLAIFIAKPTEKAKLQVFINPKITKIEEPTGKAKGKTKKLEGCLSLHNIWGEVERAKAVWLDYMDETPQKIQRFYCQHYSTRGGSFKWNFVSQKSAGTKRYAL